MPCQCQHKTPNGVAFTVPAQARLASKPRCAQRKSARSSDRTNRRERAVKQCVCAAPASQRSDISTRQVVNKPRSAETARTIVDIVAHGTLCTSGEDGLPLGTYCNYVLDDQGLPVLRLRANAVHTANLKRSPKCSLFVQPGKPRYCKLYVSPCLHYLMILSTTPCTLLSQTVLHGLYAGSILTQHSMCRLLKHKII